MYPESITAEMSEEALENYRQDLQNLGAELEAEYDLVQYSFGQDVREGIDSTFEDKVSNLAAMLNTVYDLYSNQNLGAVILASDGIYNQGSNPIYSSTKLAAPIYTVALGDTVPKRRFDCKKSIL